MAAKATYLGSLISQSDRPAYKNVWVAGLLTLFFGPPGMFYSTPIGALVMTIVSVAVIFVGNWLLSIAVWAVCIFWAVMAARD